MVPVALRAGGKSAGGTSASVVLPADEGFGADDLGEVEADGGW